MKVLKNYSTKTITFKTEPPVQTSLKYINHSLNIQKGVKNKIKLQFKKYIYYIFI